MPDRKVYIFCHPSLRITQEEIYQAFQNQGINDEYTIIQEATIAVKDMLVELRSNTKNYPDTIQGAKPKNVR